MPQKDLAPLIEQVVNRLRLTLSLQQQDQLTAFVILLLEGTETQRLVGGKTGREIICKHIYDSLYPLTLIDLQNGDLLDLGTGAGLPGLPWKICVPRLPVYLMDSNQRKINFLRRAVRETGLKEVFFLAGRAEEWGREPDYRERFTSIVSRAVAVAATLAELALPLLKKGGDLIMLKGPRGYDEIAEAGEALSCCGGRVESHWSYRLPSGERRTLFIVRKIGETPLLYPRRTGKPSKKPLGS